MKEFYLCAIIFSAFFLCFVFPLFSFSDFSVSWLISLFSMNLTTLLTGIVVWHVPVSECAGSDRWKSDIAHCLCS